MRANQPTNQPRLCELTNSATGTSSIVDEKTHKPLISILSGLVETACKLRDAGHKVVFVSSGAIGVGLKRMNIAKKPPAKRLPEIQALAAIGQGRLMSLWDQLFQQLDQPVAQILLTRGDFADRTRYQNAQKTIFQLFEMGVIPIVNENDTLSVSEIKFGDNDTLSAITANMVHADYLFLMTDVDCLYDKNPRLHPDAKPIEVVNDISALDVDVSSKGSSLGTGGMSTKIVAARLATSAGCMTVITRSSKPENIFEIVRYVEAQKAARKAQSVSSILHQNLRNRLSQQPDPIAQTTDSLETSIGDLSSSMDDVKLSEASTSATNQDDASETTLVTSSSPTINGTPGSPATPTPTEVLEVPAHTRFTPGPPIRDRSFWILQVRATHGSLYIDAGAFKALATKAGLLPVGVVDVEGTFAQQECVNLCVVNKTMAYDEHGVYRAVFDRSTVELVGRAIVNYSSNEIRKIKGAKAKEIEGVLGYSEGDYVALRENIAFYKPNPSRPVTPSQEPPTALGLSSTPGTPDVFGLRSP